ncbi:SDR family NAD(P)-dependent oxidoreductase [Georgenia wutianyii]|uniref:SDR family NAD(P)-dependent oxidoreductase n=1 Tax=Georgenia wutianyii TaxID=2585135 RepID=UPI00143D3356|nr:SDR family NAD(P)-dependent oxidoreductase [Georgenia wutianyii]
MTRPVAVVTGGARGIGRAIAAELLARGLRVVLADLDGAEATARELGAVGRHLDVTDRRAVEALVADVEESLGPIAVWVNNAGVMPTGAFLDQQPDVDDLVLDVDYRAVVHATRAVVPRMVRRGRGAVVQVASATGAKPMAGLAVYSGTKAAVVAFSEALRRELRGTGVDVLVVLPYLAATPMGAGIRSQRGFRPVTAEEVAVTTVRALERRRAEVYVPRWLGPAAHLFRELPLAVRGVLDDALASDRIGLGGDPDQRRRYLRQVRRNAHR